MNDNGENIKTTKLVVRGPVDRWQVRRRVVDSGITLGVIPKRPDAPTALPAPEKPPEPPPPPELQDMRVLVRLLVFMTLSVLIALGGFVYIAITKALQM